MSNSFLESDENKTKLSSNNIFDRIINLKLKCGYRDSNENKVEEEFVIRSDYELVELPNGTEIIRRCSQKPSIKIQYNMATSEVGTAIDIYISNFFIFTSDGKHLMSFNKAEYDLLGVEIAMGYWGQFKDTVKSHKDYFNIKAVNGADLIEIRNVTYVTTDKLPPDSVMHIKGFVGNILSSPVALAGITDYDSATSNTIIKSSSKLSDMLFDKISRRYLRSGALATKELAPTIEESTGMMSVEEAKQKGINVIVTQKAEESIKIEKKPDSEGNEVEVQAYYEDGDTVGQTLNRFLTNIDSSLTCRFTNNGDLLVFTLQESSNAQDLHKSFKSLDVYENTNLHVIYNNEIPAVYNINIDAVATIVCPFFSFIEPFEEIKFASRYALTSLVEYFAPDFRANEFVAIKVSVSFATVENINEMQIVAVAKNKK